MVRVWLHADRAYAGAIITNTVSLDTASVANVFMVSCNDTISRTLVVDELLAGTQFIHVFVTAFRDPNWRWPPVCRWMNTSLTVEQTTMG